MFVPVSLSLLCVLAVRKRDLGASCDANDVCHDDNAHCTTTTSSSSSGSITGSRTCQCIDAFYQTVNAVCSMYHTPRCSCDFSVQQR